MHGVEREIGVHRRLHHIEHGSGEALDTAAPRDAVVDHQQLRTGRGRGLNGPHARIDAKGDLRHLVADTGNLEAVVRDIGERLNIQRVVNPIRNLPQFHSRIKIPHSVPFCKSQVHKFY